MTMSLPVPRSCRQCGCTDTHACVDDRGPCWWVEADLCSHCATPAGALNSAAVVYAATERAALICEEMASDSTLFLCERNKLLEAARRIREAG